MVFAFYTFMKGGKTREKIDASIYTESDSQYCNWTEGNEQHKDRSLDGFQHKMEHTENQYKWEISKS